MFEEAGSRSSTAGVARGDDDHCPTGIVQIVASIEVFRGKVVHFNATLIRQEYRCM